MAATLDGNATRSQRTRGRILAASLALFNARGVAGVTSGTIAAEVGISAGNLHYHFRTKDRIVEELLRGFEARMELRPSEALGRAEVLEDLWIYLHLMLEAVAEYRFLYRGMEELLQAHARLRAPFARVVARQLAGIEGACTAAARAGVMRAQDDEIRTLARNMLLVMTFWPSFAALREPRAGTAEAGAHGAYQVMSLVAPHLAGAARRHFERLGRQYLD